MRAPLHHVDLTVRDLAESVDFYGRVLTRLGYRRVSLPDDQAPCWELDGDAFSIALHAARSNAPHDRYASGLHHLAFRAASRAEVHALHEFLVAARVEVLDAPAEYDYTPGYYAVFFADPDGLKLELVHEPD